MIDEWDHDDEKYRKRVLREFLVYEPCCGPLEKHKQSLDVDRIMFVDREYRGLE